MTIFVCRHIAALTYSTCVMKLKRLQEQLGESESKRGEANAKLKQVAAAYK